MVPTFLVSPSLRMEVNMSQALRLVSGNTGDAWTPSPACSGSSASSSTGKRNEDAPERDRKPCSVASDGGAGAPVVAFAPAGPPAVCPCPVAMASWSCSFGGGFRGGRPIAGGDCRSSGASHVAALVVIPGRNVVLHARRIETREQHRLRQLEAFLDDQWRRWCNSLHIPWHSGCSGWRS